MIYHSRLIEHSHFPSAAHDLILLRYSVFADPVIAVVLAVGSWGRSDFSQSFGSFVKEGEGEA